MRRNWKPLDAVADIVDRTRCIGIRTGTKNEGIIVNALEEGAFFFWCRFHRLPTCLDRWCPDQYNMRTQSARNRSDAKNLLHLKVFPAVTFDDPDLPLVPINGDAQHLVITDGRTGVVTPVHEG